MSARLPKRLAFIGVFILALIYVPHALAQEPNSHRPIAVLLEDDIDTRGDWLGVYGTYAYVLCGMRAPKNLSGGRGWPLQSFSVTTGDPEEYARGWRSSAPSEDDRSVLLDPSGIKRTPAIWDDHGEVRPLGEGPDLHVRFELPEGLFLTAFYFFEADWIQYRAYRIKIYSDEKTPELLIDTTVDNFLKGKYKRFAILGPAKILIVIERGQSPNATLSGIFLNELPPPNTHLLDWTMSRFEVPLPPVLEGTDLDVPSLKAEAAAKALADVTETTPASQTALQNYIAEEALYLKTMSAFISATPEQYLPSMNSSWHDMQSRIVAALPANTTLEDEVLLRLLMYYALRANCDFAGARQEMDDLTGLLAASGLAAQEEWPRDAEIIETMATWFMFSGRRAEAAAALRVCGTLCLQKLPPEKSCEKLIALGRDSLRAGVPSPMADALTQWQEKNGILPTNGRSLLAGLHYAGGENPKALAEYSELEPALQPGLQHRWVLVAMLTAHLRENKLAQAEKIMDRLSSQYPASAEVDEAIYRLGVYHFDRRELSEAKQRFTKLKDTTASETYKRMCAEYLDRIEYLESLLPPRDGGEWSLPGK